MSSAHQLGETSSPLTVNTPSRGHAWRECRLLSPPPRHRPVVPSRRWPSPPSCHPNKSLCHQYSTSFSNPNCSDPWLLVQCNQPASHHGLIGGPWGPPISKPLRKTATIIHSPPLDAPKRRSQCWRLTESVPPIPAPPEILSATTVTVLSVIPTGTNSGGQSW